MEVATLASMASGAALWQREGHLKRQLIDTGADEEIRLKNTFRAKNMF